MLLIIPFESFNHNNFTIENRVSKDPLSIIAKIVTYLKQHWTQYPHQTSLEHIEPCRLPIQRTNVPIYPYVPFRLTHHTQNCLRRKLLCFNIFVRDPVAFFWVCPVPSLLFRLLVRHPRRMKYCLGDILPWLPCMLRLCQIC